MGREIDSIEHPTSLDQRKARFHLAEDFLDTVLIPAVNTSLLQHQDLDQLYEQFKKTHIGLGDDFLIQHVWGVALRRNIDNEEDEILNLLEKIMFGESYQEVDENELAYKKLQVVPGWVEEHFGKWAAFSSGQLVMEDPNRDNLITRLRNLSLGGLLVQIGIEPPTIDFHV